MNAPAITDRPNTRPARRRRAAPVCVLACLLALLLPAVAAAQSATCWISSPPRIDFGTVTPSGATASGSLGYQCVNGTPDTVTMRLCVFMNPNDGSGIDPRRMTLYWPQSYLNFDFYADPAHSLLVGSETSGHPVYGTVLTLESNAQPTGTTTLYAKVPAGQTVAAGGYVSQNTIVLRTAYSNDGVPPTDEECAAGALQTQYVEAIANFANACYISTATDLDFGSVTRLDATRAQTSTISLNCPDQTAWRVALDYGAHASGTERRLAGPAGLLGYQLYRDSGHSQVWGNSTADDVVGTGNNQIQTLTVYGQIPAQEVAGPGTYSDTITITLTY